jgi:hypothetical protein
MELAISGHTVLIDDADYEKVSIIKWHVYQYGTELWYASGGSKGHTIYMHRVIVDVPAGMSVDHINGNGLDNRRDNLRVCLHQQNLSNQHHQRRLTHSRYKGVTFNKNRASQKKPWIAQIKAFQKHYGLGYFATEIEAARAYNEAATRFFGEYARLNDI